MAARPPQTLLGFDYGTRRIGIAVGQVITGTARPLTTLQSRNGKPDWDGIGRLIRDWLPDALVVGLPRHMDGSEHELTEAARRFGNQLAGRYNLPVYHVDERLTSVEAEQQLGTTGDKGEVDRLAARIILEDWLRQQEQAR